MSTSVPKATPVPPGAMLTMAGLRDAIQVAQDISPRRRGEVVSSHRSFEKAVGRPLITLSAAPVELRKLLKNVTPAMMGLSAGRWRNVLSDIQFALGWAGLSRIPARYTEKLTPQWAALISEVAAMGDRYKLGHLGRYCGRAGIAPADVTAAVMDRFLSDLLLYSLVQEPERRHRDAVMAWNRCVALYPAWPQLRLAVPDNRDTYSLPWSTLLIVAES